MPVITIQITVPEGVQVVVTEEPDQTDSIDAANRDPGEIKRYFTDWLSDNGRKLFAAAARIEQHQGPGYTLTDIAANLSIEYGSAKSYLITSGRSARKWRDETGTQAPIQLEDLNYHWIEEENAMRSGYHLPAGVADVIASLPLHPTACRRRWKTDPPSPVEY
jgi:hypothetical protein